MGAPAWDFSIFVVGCRHAFRSERPFTIKFLQIKIAQTTNSTIHYSTLHYSPELQSVMQYSTVQSSAVQCVSKLVNPKPVMTLTHHGCRQQQLTSLPKAQPPRASAGAATTHTCVGRCCYSPHVRRQVLLLPVWQWRQQQPLPVSRTLQDVETIKP